VLIIKPVFEPIIARISTAREAGAVAYRLLRPIQPRKPPTVRGSSFPATRIHGLKSERLNLFCDSECEDRGGVGPFGLKQSAQQRSATLMQTNRRTWQSFDEMRTAAEEGEGAAQCYLGVCYQSGIGVPREYGQAAKWFREAADQGDPAAQFNLGVLYETGQGVPQNYAEAVKWYHAAAEQGEPQAQFNLGVFYETGQVVPQNYEEAVKWYRASAEQECAPAQCNLGLCYETGRGVPKNVREAVKWFCRAARAGDKTAQHNLGVYYATLEAAEAATAQGETPTPATGDATA
jgi:TPR repeat protein